MSEPTHPPAGPDLAAGIPLASLADGAMLLGHVGEAPVLLARRGDELFAVDDACTHYGGPLHEGLLVDDTVRCPWHHACFGLRDGAVRRAPALAELSCWRIERHDDRVFVRERLARAERARAARPGATSRTLVIVGGGAAGFAAAETLRREGHDGRIVILSADADAPYDRPNLSKAYLAGTASEDWIPLRPADSYRERGIELRLGTRVAALEPAARRVRLADGETVAYDGLLLATGADPVHLPIPGAELPHVHTLRTLADSRAIVAAAASGPRVVVIGASFIGMEVAAALRARGLEVRVVAPEPVPMERVLGPEVGRHLRAIHEQHGVRFHLGATVAAIGEREVTLSDGTRVGAELVVAGIGVRPATALAAQAGLAVDRGVLVDEYLCTSAPDVYAAGDIARWPDPLSGEHLRVEHWVVAQRQGQTAARNLLGRRERFDAVPFFWTEQYDLVINYVGHAERWDAVHVDGALEANDCTITYRRDGRALAVATVHRDIESLRAEREFETAAPRP